MSNKKAVALMKARSKGTGRRLQVEVAVSPEPEENQNALDDANISDDEEGGTRIGDIYIPPPIPPYCSTESKGPRLIIKRIVNKNFKSYAGEVVLGPFHHCFTAIIGPNGSGKSNVIDSMLFVFGYRANKIRCKKLSTLLHNSASFPNMTMCSVAVHFRKIVDHEDGSCEDLPDSEIIVERTAFRDNSSFYTINGRRVQFKEVAKMLKQHGVDLQHNRFLILQGEVESIAMMKSKGQNENECGMLEYLEDIVGTTRYKAPLIKINERVEHLTEERTEKHNRCKLAERDMKDLEMPYNEAVDYLRKENDNTRTKNLRIQKYISEKNKKLEQYTKEHDEAKDELKTHDEAYEAVRKERTEKEATMNKDMTQFESLRRKKEEAEKKHEKATGDFAEVQQLMAMTNKRRKQNKTQIEKLEAEIKELRKIPGKNKQEIDECEKKVEKLSKDKTDQEEELQKNYAVLEEHTKPLIEKREQLEPLLVDLQRMVDAAKAQVALAESEHRILRHDETTETRKYETMRSSYEESVSSLDQKRSQVEELKLKMPKIEEEIEMQSQQVVKLRKNEENMNAKLRRLLSEINEKKATMQASRSKNKVLDFLMRQKNEGNISGILGRLGDLGAIDQKYDVAISTACGRLDNILVETADAAHQCINALKEYDVGRASFLALDKLQHWGNKSGAIQTPEQAPRLYDLVRVEDERVLPAFYFALRNTLVAKDLEQGTRIAYGARRFRVVTLAGDTIETSGTMSGGGRTQIRGKMGTEVQTKTNQGADTSIVTQKALEEMQLEAEKLQSEINYSQETQGKLEHEVQLLRGQLKKHDTEITKMIITIKSLDGQLPHVLKQLETQRKRMQEASTDPVKVKEMVSEIEQKQKIVSKTEKGAITISQKIDEITKQIEVLHGDKVKSVQNKIKNLGTQIKKLTSQIAKLNVEVTTSERNVSKKEKQIVDLHNEITKAECELKELNVNRQKHDDDSLRLSNDIKEIQAEIDSAKGEFSGIQKEIMLLQKRESDSKLARVELEQKLQTVATKMNDVKNQIPHWRDQLKPLRLHKIPGDTEPETPLKIYTEDELATHTLQDIQYKESVEEEELKKKPNLSCINEYLEKRELYLERVKVLEDITSKRNEMRQLYDDVRKKRYMEFMRGFHIITRKLKEMYQMITQGGDAELELVDSMDPFTEGVAFSVRPPKKTWKNISNLSGGEKTLSSLALVFALHYYKPSPLYFMDEIDAALDFKNISIVAHYIKERTKNAQFIIISLRTNMFELSNMIVGIYKMRDCTDSATIVNVPPTDELRQLQSQSQILSTETVIEDNSEHFSPITQPEPENFTAMTQPTVIDDNFEPMKEDAHVRETLFAPTLESTQLTIIKCANSLSISADVANIENSTKSSIEALFKKPLPPTQKSGVV